LALQGKTPYAINALIQQIASLDHQVKEQNRAIGVQTEISRLLLAKVDKRGNAITNHDNNIHTEENHQKGISNKKN
jgi:hypothetical protein